MNKALKKLKVKSINKFKHFLNIVVRILKYMVQSCLICYTSAVAFIIMNSLLGVHIRVSYYFMFASIAMFTTTAILVFINRNLVMSKPVKVSKKPVPTDNQDRAKRRVQRNRRKIS